MDNTTTTDELFNNIVTGAELGPWDTEESTMLKPILEPIYINFYNEKKLVAITKTWNFEIDDTLRLGGREYVIEDIEHILGDNDLYINVFVR